MKKAGSVGVASGEDRTRTRVAREILDSGSATAAALAQRLGLTSAAVRRHLDALLHAGLVAPIEPPHTAARGRGRPAKAFVLTAAGRDSFFSAYDVQAYDDLATDALHFLAGSAGPAAVQAFARSRGARLEARYRPVVHGGSSQARARDLAEVLSADGYAAEVTAGPEGDGLQLCQHHCPVAHVATEFPELCEAETEAFARLLGTSVQRTVTIAQGASVCKTAVPDQASHRSAAVLAGGHPSPRSSPSNPSSSSNPPTRRTRP